MKKVVLIILAIIIALIPFYGWVLHIIKVCQFEAACGEYLALAADANDVNVAEKHLTTAITYLEENNLTEGYNKIFIYRPRNDIGLWYENLKTAQSQLQELKNSDYTELEESNMLMKLRETLLNNDAYVTTPLGIATPHNFPLIFWTNCLLWLPCWAVAIILTWYICEYC